MPVSISSRVCDMAMRRASLRFLVLAPGWSCALCRLIRCGLEKAMLSLTRGILLGRIGYALAMPSALFVLPPVFPVPRLSAALAHHRDRGVGGGKVMRCGRRRL